MSHTLPSPPYSHDEAAREPSGPEQSIRGFQQPAPGRGPGGRAWYVKRRFLLPVTALLALVLGAAMGSTEDSVTASDLERAFVERDAAIADADEAGEKAAAAEDHAEEAISDARADMEAELAAQEEQLDERITQREQKLQALATQLDERSAGLDERETAVTHQEEVKARNEFGAGVYEVGVDIDPGQYAADAPAGCYWARLGSDGQTTHDNHFQGEPGQAVAVIQPSDGFFETSGCGTWQRRD